MRVLAFLTVLLVLSSCGVSVGVDYDEATDFSSYTSYNYYPSIDSGMSPLDDKRIIRITDSLLQERGMVKSETPQLYINFYAQESISTSNNTIGFGIGGGGRNGGVSVGGGLPVGGKSINNQLTLDFIDVNKDDLVWQGVANGAYKERQSPQKRDAYFFGAIQKILKKYPPKK